MHVDPPPRRPFNFKLYLDAWVDTDPIRIRPAIELHHILAEIFSPYLVSVFAVEDGGLCKAGRRVVTAHILIYLFTALASCRHQAVQTCIMA
jgi:hypothetical protein